MARLTSASAALLWLAALPAGAETLDGSWTVTSPLWRVPHLCTFRQAQDAFSANCVGPHGRGEGAGTMKGDAVTWDWPAATASGTTVWSFTGALAADGTIRGTLRHGVRHEAFVARRPELS